MVVKINEIKVDGYEKIVEGIDEEAGLHCIIAVHSTVLGPALGGTRIYPYKTREEALTDVLRLSKGMSYKSAIAEVGFGGGKSVIIADPRKDKTDRLLLGFAEVVNSLKGSYICAKDMGSTLADLTIISSKTRYVAEQPGDYSSGDPSPFTAWGVFRGIQSAVHKIFGSSSLEGKTVAIQGVGSVGEKLAEFLFWHGAKLIVSDVDSIKVRDCVKHYSATSVSPEEIYGVECDVFAPCALGGILNHSTVPKLRCKAVAGGANNQLLKEEDGDLLTQRGILYAPDFVINAGGLINTAIELEKEGYNSKVSRDKIDKIYSSLLHIYDLSEAQKMPTDQIVIELAEHKMKQRIGKRQEEVYFHHASI